MKRFSCGNGHSVYFDNFQCLSCGTPLGFAPNQLELLSLTTASDGVLLDPRGSHWRRCRNGVDFQVCNWLVDVHDPDPYCVACRLNRTIPNLSGATNLEHWRQLEAAKRRLVYSLLRFALPVASQVRGWPLGLAFDFIEDQRSDPRADQEYVMTGHEGGVITINVAEADDVIRALIRKRMNEQYRTLLGHFRHESGHYYFDHLVGDDAARTAFRDLFGDERGDYDSALEQYYQDGPPRDWSEHFVSAYAASHPHEDWAETWAHYLHITDCLETAGAHGLTPAQNSELESDWIDAWRWFAVVLNELNRSMGLRDAYPFVINDEVAAKLRFIHQRLRHRHGAPPAPS